MSVAGVGVALFRKVRADLILVIAEFMQHAEQGSQNVVCAICGDIEISNSA